MSFFNRDNLFNYKPIPRAIPGNPGPQGVTGLNANDWVPFSSSQYIPSEVGYTNLPGLSLGSDQFVKYQGGVLAPNDLIYFVPGTTDKVLVLDPKTETYTYPSGLTGLGLPSGLKWFGGIVAPNGKIYCIPDQPTTNSVLIIDPNGNTYDNKTITGITNLPNGPHGWKSGVLHPNGKIYCVPYTSKSVLIIDPVGNTVDTTEITGLGEFNETTNVHKWHSGVLSQNGKIYCIPLSDSPGVLILDPNSPVTGLTNSNPSTYFSGFTISGRTLTTNDIGFTTRIQIGDNLIVTSSGNTNYTYYVKSILNSNNIDFIYNRGVTLLNNEIINIQKTRKVDITSIPLEWYYYRYSGGALGINGKIYCMPYGQNNVLVIDPIGNTTYTLPNITGLSIKYRSAILAPDGKIYGCPCGDTRFVVIDTSTQTEGVTIKFLNTNYNSFYDQGWFGGVLAPNGRIYGVPATRPNIYVIQTGLPKYPNWMLDPYFNKF
jgi:hypothetical protein